MGAVQVVTYSKSAVADAIGNCRTSPFFMVSFPADLYCMSSIPDVVHSEGCGPAGWMSSYAGALLEKTDWLMMLLATPDRR